MIVLDGRKAWTAMHFAAPGTDRPTCGFLVEPHETGGVIIVATDGVRMVVIRDETGQTDHGPEILRLDIGLMKRLRAGTRLLVEGTVTGWCGGVAGSSEAAGVHYRTTDSIRWTENGPFPNWRKALDGTPTGRDGAAVDFEKLDSFRYLWSTAPTKRDRQRAFSMAHLDNGYLFLRSYQDGDRFGLLAPIDEDPLVDMPEWVRPREAHHGTVNAGGEPQTLQISQADDPHDWSAHGESWTPPPPREVDDGAG